MQEKAVYLRFVFVYVIRFLFPVYIFITFVVFNQNDSGLHQKIDSFFFLIKNKNANDSVAETLLLGFDEKTSLETAIASALSRRVAEI